MVVLSRIERRRLDEIERYLRATDPRFAARMRWPGHDRMAAIAVGHGVWLVAGVVAVVGSAAAGLVTAVLLSASTTLGRVAVRWRHLRVNRRG